MSEAWLNTTLRPLLIGGIGGGLVGLVEVIHVILTGRHGLGVIGMAALLVLGIGFSSLCGALVTGMMGWIPSLRDTRGWPLLVGFSAPLSLSVAVWGFGTADSIAPILGVLLIAAPLLLGSAAAAAATRNPRINLISAGGFVFLSLGYSVILRSGVDTPIIASVDHPNLLLVTIDGARADRFGAHAIDTSAFDRLAAEGASFHVAFSPTPDSRVANTTIHTGAGPWDHGLMPGDTQLDPQRFTMAQAIANAGYETGAFVSHEDLDRALGLDRGFHVYDDDFGWIKGLDHLLLGRLFATQSSFALSERLGSHTIDRATRWIGHRSTAWFAWVHLADPRAPYHPPHPYDERYYRGLDPRSPTNGSMQRIGALPPDLADEFQGITDTSYLIARYDGEVAWTDSQVGRLLAWLDDSGQASSTLIAIVGTHGEGLGEDGEWFRHGDRLGDHDLRVPMAIRLPGRIPAGTRIERPVEVGDLVPTLLEYLGLAPLRGATGVDLRPTIEERGSARLYARALTWEPQTDRTALQVAIRAPGVHFVHHPTPGIPDEARIIPGEQTDGEWSPSKVRQLLQWAHALLPDPASSVHLQPEHRELLRSLGYRPPVAPMVQPNRSIHQDGQTTPPTVSPARLSDNPK